MCQRETPTVASAAKATRVSTVIGGWSLRPAGGSTAGTGSVASRRAGRPSVTVSQDTPGPPVTQVNDVCLIGIIKSVKISKHSSRLMSRVHVSGRDGQGAAEAPPATQNMYVHQ